MTSSSSLGTFKKQLNMESPVVASNSSDDTNESLYVFIFYIKIFLHYVGIYFLLSFYFQNG